MTKLFNQKFTKQTRRKLRKNLSTPEVILWSRIRNRQLQGHKFRRQYSIAQHIVDFYCPQKKLIIEIDGHTHSTKKQITKDKAREKLFIQNGLSIIRFTNQQIMRNIEGVLEDILKHLA